MYKTGGRRKKKKWKSVICGKNLSAKSYFRYSSKILFLICSIQTPYWYCTLFTFFWRYTFILLFFHWPNVPINGSKMTVFPMKRHRNVLSFSVTSVRYTWWPTPLSLASSLSTLFRTPIVQKISHWTESPFVQQLIIQNSANCSKGLWRTFPALVRSETKSERFCH